MWLSVSTKRKKRKKSQVSRNINCQAYYTFSKILIFVKGVTSPTVSKKLLYLNWQPCFVHFFSPRKYVTNDGVWKPIVWLTIILPSENSIAWHAAFSSEAAPPVHVRTLTFHYTARVWCGRPSHRRFKRYPWRVMMQLSSLGPDSCFVKDVFGYDWLPCYLVSLWWSTRNAAPVWSCDVC